MSRLAELEKKWATQLKVVSDLAEQAGRTKGEEATRLLRKRDQAALAAQTTRNDIDRILNRVGYLQQAHRLAQENLAVIERHLHDVAADDSVRAGGLIAGRRAAQREIDGILSELAKLGLPETQG